MLRVDETRGAGYDARARVFDAAFMCACGHHFERHWQGRHCVDECYPSGASESACKQFTPSGEQELIAA